MKAPSCGQDACHCQEVLQSSKPQSLLLDLIFLLLVRVSPKRTGRFFPWVLELSGRGPVAGSRWDESGDVGRWWRWALSLKQTSAEYLASTPLKWVCLWASLSILPSGAPNAHNP